MKKESETFSFSPDLADEGDCLFELFDPKGRWNGCPFLNRNILKGWQPPKLF